MSDTVLLMLYIATGIIALAMILMFVRFLIGPKLVDRTIVFDTLTVVTLAFIAIFAVLSGREMYLDVNIIYGLLSFTSVIVIGKYIDKSI